MSMYVENVGPHVHQLSQYKKSVQNHWIQFFVIWFELSNQVTNLHIKGQLDCHGMCKSVIWSDNYTSHKSNTIFARFVLCAHNIIVEREPRFPSWRAYGLNYDRCAHIVDIMSTLLIHHRALRSGQSVAILQTAFSNSFLNCIFIEISP